MALPVPPAESCDGEHLVQFYDTERFREVMVPLIARAGTGGRRLRVFGEMAALLWDAGDVASTLALERLLNDLQSTHQLARLCAYPIRAFERDGSATAFRQSASSTRR
jgi:hypothetical protein